MSRMWPLQPSYRVAGSCRTHTASLRPWAAWMIWPFALVCIYSFPFSDAMTSGVLLMSSSAYFLWWRKTEPLGSGHVTPYNGHNVQGVSFAFYSVGQNFRCDILIYVSPAPLTKLPTCWLSTYKASIQMPFDGVPGFRKEVRLETGLTGRNPKGNKWPLDPSIGLAEGALNLDWMAPFACDKTATAIADVSGFQKMSYWLLWSIYWPNYGRAIKIIFFKDFPLKNMQHSKLTN